MFKMKFFDCRKIHYSSGISTRLEIFSTPETKAAPATYRSGEYFPRYKINFTKLISIRIVKFTIIILFKGERNNA